MAILVEITKRQIEKKIGRNLTFSEMESTLRFLENEIEELIQNLLDEMKNG